VYSRNISVLTGSPLRDSSVLDVYTPAGDALRNRPLVIYFHTGSFLPPLFNGGITGARSDSSCVEFARRLTRLGYVVAIASYRLGWNPVATGPEGQNTRTGTLLNAAYRGVQDARSAIRFFRRSIAENNNPYGVDGSKIVLWGQGTGGYIAYGAAYLDRYKEEIQIPKFLNTNTLQAFVDTALNGNPFGTTAKPLNLVNHAGYSSTFNLAVNMGGALGDATWLEGKAGEPATIGFHVLSDPFAPFADGAVIVPTTREFVVNVSGTRSVTGRANQLGLNNVFQSANTAQNAVNLINRAYSAVPLPSPTFNVGGQPTTLSTDNMYPFRTPNNRLEAGPWEWWDTTTLKIVVDRTNAATGQNFNARTLHTNGLLTNPNMSKTKAMAYIDTIMAVYIPRAFLALNLTTSVKNVISAESVNLKMSPNPATDFIYFEADREQKIEDIAVYNLEGKLVTSVMNVNSNQYMLSRGNLPRGMYVVQLSFKQGYVAKKLMLE
jgi:Secretion system C-terminal sorting domain